MYIFTYIYAHTCYPSCMGNHCPLEGQCDSLVRIMTQGFGWMWDRIEVGCLQHLTPDIWLVDCPLRFKHTVPTCENIAYLKGNVIHLLESCLKCSIGSGAQGKLGVMDNRHKECGMPLNLLCEAWNRFHCMDKYNLVFIPELWLNAYITRETHSKHSRIYQNHKI